MPAKIYSRQWLADHYGMSRKTLLKWLGEHEIEFGLAQYVTDKFGFRVLRRNRILTPKQISQITELLGMPESLKRELKGKS